MTYFIDTLLSNIKKVSPSCSLSRSLVGKCGIYASPLTALMDAKISLAVAKGSTNQVITFIYINLIEKGWIYMHFYLSFEVCAHCLVRNILVYLTLGRGDIGRV